MALDNDTGGSWLEPLLRPIVRQQAALDAFFRKQFWPNSLATWFLRALRSQDHQFRAGAGHLVPYAELATTVGGLHLRFRQE